MFSYVRHNNILTVFASNERNLFFIKTVYEHEHDLHNRGRRRMTYIDDLLRDTELRTIMEDRELWSNHVNSIFERPKQAISGII